MRPVPRSGYTTKKYSNNTDDEDITDDKDAPDLGDEQFMNNQTDQVEALYDLTDPSRMSDMERIGSWTLARENMGSLDGIAEESKHRLIANLLKTHISFEGTRLPILVGREMREFAHDIAIEPSDGSSPFTLRVLDKDSPLARHLTHSVHNEMGCRLSKATYLDALLRRGFYWKGARGAFQSFTDACPSCTLMHAAMRNHACKVSGPGADYVVKEVLSNNPLSSIIIDETGPIIMENGEKVCALMCTELMSGRTILLGMNSNKTVDLIDTLERLQAVRGGMETVILDPAPSHQVIANAASVTTQGLFMRKKLNNKVIRRKLKRMGITIKLTSSAAHHQAGRAENVSKQVKIFTFNVLLGMKIRNGIHLQSILDKMMACINNRVRFIDHEGLIHTANSTLEACARISTSEVQDLSDLINTKSEKIITGVNAVAQETKRIVTIFAHQYMAALLSWQITRYGDQPAIYPGDVVIILDKITMHHYKSARRSIGVVLSTSKSGFAFRIKMCTKGKGDRRLDSVKHRKHLLLLARGAENKDKVNSIDPLSDGNVQQLLNELPHDLNSSFFEGAMERLPDMTEIAEELKQFEDPEDLWTLAQINDPATASDILNPREEIIPDLIIREEKAPSKLRKSHTKDQESIREDEVADEVAEAAKKPEEKVEPVKYSRGGRALKKPAKYM